MGEATEGLFLFGGVIKRENAKNNARGNSF